MKEVNGHEGEDGRNAMHLKSNVEVEVVDICMYKCQAYEDVKIQCSTEEK